MKSIISLFFCAFLIGSLLSCKRNPVDRLMDPNPSGALPEFSGEFFLYEDEIETGGGLNLIPGADNQTIDVTDHSSPRRSINAIKYSWNGRDVYSYETGLFQHAFAGFNLFITPDDADLAAAPGKDLSGPGYNKLKFFIRGSLTEGNTVRIEGPDDGAGGNTPALIESGTHFTLTNDWQEITMNIPTNHFNSVKIYLTVTIQYDQAPRTTPSGDGGVIYLDDIRYED